MIALLALPLVLLETHVEKEIVYVHEPVRVTLRIRFDESELARRAVQLFANELDLPVRVEAPWLGGADGAAMEPPEDPAGPSIALNDKVRSVRRVPGGVEIVRVFLPEREGELRLPAATARYATATEFRDDFVHGRVPVDRRDFTARAEPVVLRVLPLPEAGRPERFGGAVGRFELSVRVPAGPVRPMEPFPVEVHIDGEGNLERFPPPHFAPGGFHVFGRTDHGGRPRRLTYDVAVTEASVTAFPALVLPYFDPAAAAYREARTEPVPIEVERPPAPAEGGRAPLFGVLAALAVLAGAGAILLRRSRRGEPDRAQRAAAAFREGGTFPAYLAAVLDVPEPAVIAPDLAARLEASGVPTDLAARAASLVEREVAARYRGPRATGGGAPLRAEAESLVRAIGDAVSVRASPRAGPGSRSGR